MGLLLTFFILAAFGLAGDALLRCLRPTQALGLAQRIVLAAWLGLAFHVLALCNLYFLFPGLTVREISWPLMAACILASGASVKFRPWPKPEVMDLFERASLLVPSLAVVVFSLPLVDLGRLGFYYSNNGEFSNYAALGDICQYHGSATPSSWPLVCRESVVGSLSAYFATLWGSATLWVIQPMAAAISWVALATLGLLFDRIAKGAGGKIQLGALLALYAWASFSASAQQFWTCSWVSQYISIGLFFGAIAYLAQWPTGKSTQPASLLVQATVLGIILGAQACSYPELWIANALLLAGFILILAVPQGREGMLGSWRLGCLSLGIGAIVGNRFAFQMVTKALVVARDQITYNPFGGHDDPLQYLSNLVGFANIFSGPHSPHAPSALLLATGLAMALVFTLLHQREPFLRSLVAAAGAFFLGVTALFVVVHHHGTGFNYTPTKFIFQFHWLAYLMLGIGIAALREKRALLAIALLMGLLTFDWARTGILYARFQRADSRSAVFSEEDGSLCRKALAPGATVFVAASPTLANYKVIGKFLAYGEDLLVKNGAWAAEDPRPYVRGETVLLVGRLSNIADDKAVRGSLKAFYSRPCFSLLREAP